MKTEPCKMGPAQLLFLPLILGAAAAGSPVLGRLESMFAQLASIDSQLDSALGWRHCKPSTILRPTSTEQVADLLAAILEESSLERRFHVRATSGHFLSHNNFTCPEDVASSDNGSPSIHAVALDMRGLSSVLEITPHTMTVGAGITFRDLQEELLTNGLSLPGITISPHLADFTVGAALMTAAHGSSLVGPASIAAYVIKAILVDGTGQVHALDAPGDLLEGSLGMLGIVTEVTLQVVPARKVAVRQLQEEDHDMLANLRDIIETEDAVALDVTWSPAAGLYTARVWHETESDTLGEARNSWMQADPQWLAEANRQLLADQKDLNDKHGGLCQLMGDLTALPHFIKGPEDSPEQDVEGMAVGWLNHMEGSACSLGGDSERDCLWRHAKWTPHELSIASEDFADWVEDVRSIMAHAKGCPSFLFTFRFQMESDAPMAMNTGKQVVAIEISTHGGLGSTSPAKHMNLFEEIVQVTLCKYAARPHWALGTNRMFVGPCPIRDTYGSDFDTFLEQRNKYDPTGLFVPPLFTSVMARSLGVFYPGCAVAGDCYCQEDSHCGPQHRCVPGVVFTEYNTCVAEAMVSSGHQGAEL